LWLHLCDTSQGKAANLGNVNVLDYQFLPTDQPVVVPPAFQIYKCLILIERKVGEAYQYEVSKLLVETGCRWSLSWGLDCISWDDSVDWANIDQFTGTTIPEDKLVVTTWHERETLEEVVEFSKQCTDHAGRVIEDTLVLDFGTLGKQRILESLYQ